MVWSKKKNKNKINKRFRIDEIRTLTLVTENHLKFALASNICVQVNFEEKKNDDAIPPKQV